MELYFKKGLVTPLIPADKMVRDVASMMIAVAHSHPRVVLSDILHISYFFYFYTSALALSTKVLYFRNHFFNPQILTPHNQSQPSLSTSLAILSLLQLFALVDSLLEAETSQGCKIARSQYKNLLVSDKVC